MVAIGRVHYPFVLSKKTDCNCPNSILSNYIVFVIVINVKPQKFCWYYCAEHIKLPTVIEIDMISLHRFLTAWLYYFIGDIMGQWNSHWSRLYYTSVVSQGTHLGPLRFIFLLTCNSVLFANDWNILLSVSEQDAADIF